VESLNEMNSKNYADVGRHWDDKSGFAINLQGRLTAKTYYKDTDSMSSDSKSKRKKSSISQTLHKHSLWACNDKKSLLKEQMQ
jgi:hypothetical protein